jgi:hypothetical protein
MFTVFDIANTAGRGPRAEGATESVVGGRLGQARRGAA